MRTIQRILRRSGLPVEYSKGFNPHILLSIAQPLSVGVYSKGEYMDVEFTKEIKEKDILEKFNECSTRDIKAIDVVRVKEENNGKKIPPAMAVVEAARYNIKMRCNNELDSYEKIKNLMDLSYWNIIKNTKKGDKEVNIKEQLKKFVFKAYDNAIYIDTIVSCGSKSNLSPQLLAQYLKNNVETLDKEAFVDIERIDIFAINGNKLVPLNEYFK